MRKVILAVILAGIAIWAVAKDERPVSLPQIQKNELVQTVATGSKCSNSDFVIEGFSSKIFDDCQRTSCPVLKLTGKLKNNCEVAAGAQIKITAEDEKGNVVDTIDGWPASIKNIPPGTTFAFDLGPLMTYRKNMKKFQAQVIDARVWR